MADYRSPSSEQSDSAFGWSNTLKQLQALSERTQTQDLSNQEAQLKQLLQAKAQQAAKDLETQRQSGEANRQQAGFQQQKQMVPLDEASKEQFISKAAAIKKQQQSEESAAAQKIYQNVNQGEGSKASVKYGDTSISTQEENPMKYQMQQQKAGNKALSHAYDTYMHAFPEVQKRAQSAQEGLEAVNDPNQIGSIGQAKTLMIKNLGMNRYNQQEGNALVPNQLSGIVHQIFNFAGDGSNPLTPTQRQAMNTVFQGTLQSVRKQHEMAKSNALGSYMNSGYADPVQAQQFKSSLGQDFDKQMNDLTERYKQVPVNPGYTPPAPGTSAAQPPSMVDKLKSMFGMGSQQSQPAQQAPMSFEEFKAKRAAGQIK